MTLSGSIVQILFLFSESRSLLVVCGVEKDVLMRWFFVCFCYIGVLVPSLSVGLQSISHLRSSRGVVTGRKWTGGHWAYSYTKCWWGK